MTDPVRLRFTINGTEKEITIPPNAILLDVLREALDLTGTKRGCDMGTCGCCTVLIDGQARLSCLTLAAQAAGRDVATVESLGGPTSLHPLQRAFCDLGGSQCGFCTPGFLMTAKGLLDAHPHPSRDEIARAISGNLCRCTGYQPIVDAIEAAAKELRPGRTETAVVAPRGGRAR